MKQAQFEQQHQSLWQSIEQLLQSQAGDKTLLPAYYRKLCQCLALSRQRGYSPLLTDYLHELVLSTHRQIYQQRISNPQGIRYWLTTGLPQRVRQEWRIVFLIFVLFWGVALAAGLLVYFSPQWAFTWTDPQELAQYRSMYNPENAASKRNGADDDIMMFGFYIWNNVSICFRTFASGLLGGIPALVSVAFNGVHFGVVAAWLTRDANTVIPFWSFVITHSSFEITGLLLSGVAGVRLGWSLIKPERYTRRQALFIVGQHVFPILVAATVLTLLAAVFEGFWSASTAIPTDVKFIGGGICWIVVLAYFLFAGRGAHATR